MSLTFDWSGAATTIGGMAVDTSSRRPPKPCAGFSSKLPGPPPDASFDAKQTQKASAKQLDVPVETVNSIRVKLRLIPPGKFMMGSSKEEIDYWLKRSGNDEE